MSDIKYKDSTEIESMLQSTLGDQLNNEKNGDYVSAQTCRLRVDQLKKDLEQRKLYQMEQKHKKQIDQLQTQQTTQLSQFNKTFQHKMSDYHQEAQKQQKDITAKHQAQVEKLKNDLERQLPLKIKQSSELLNLRKMEQHMVKQKNYVEAHKVQTRAAQLENHQKEVWINNRNIKIQTSLNQLRNKQSIQLAALKKKIHTTIDQYDKEKFKQQTRLDKKFNNELRELKSQQQKQIIQFKGQFKSKGGQSSPLTSKSKIQ